MTSTTDTTQHPDVTEISDLAEELLPPSRAAEVSEHVDGCEPCGEVHASLMEIRELLGTVPMPQRMPDDVADRIDAALATEAALGVTTPSGSAHVSRETERPTAEKPNTEPIPSDRPAGRPRATTGPGRRPVRGRRRTAVLGAALGAAVVGVSVFMLQSVHPSQNSGSLKAADRSSSAGENSGGAFSESTLGNRVHTLLLSAGSKPSKSADGVEAEKQAPSTEAQSTPRGASGGSESPQTPLRAPTVPVPPCVEQGTGRHAPALAVEEGTYEGTDAFLVVLPHPSDATRVQAYVVDAACVRAEPEGTGELLLTRTYPRP
ncbi:MULTISPECIES: anti-sigma factor family protein [unclassified Streptomyces]|uniref:anti-sigma factor family protein n=1 Tax=unclassified Streptomyces TaxID=2593676 RepID=UPI00324D20FD